MVNPDTDSIVIRYAEIGLKGKNRFEFEKKLVDNIRLNLKYNKKDFSSINRIRGRVVIKSLQRCDCLKNVFGIVSFSHAKEMSQNIEEIRKEILNKTKEVMLKDDDTFCVRVQRVDKSFQKTSLRQKKAPRTGRDFSEFYS